MRILKCCAQYLFISLNILIDSAIWKSLQIDFKNLHSDPLLKSQDWCNLDQPSDSMLAFQLLHLRQVSQISLLLHFFFNQRFISVVIQRNFCLFSYFSQTIYIFNCRNISLIFANRAAAFCFISSIFAMMNADWL